MVRGARPGIILEELVMSGISQKARTILETIDQDAPPTMPTTRATRLSDNPATQDRIREPWAVRDLTKADIVREVGYPRQTVSLWIRSNLETEGGGGDVLP